MPTTPQASSVYLEKEIIPSMRSMIQKAQAPAKGKKGASAQPPPKVPGCVPCPGPAHPSTSCIRLSTFSPCQHVNAPACQAWNLHEPLSISVTPHLLCTGAADVNTVHPVQVQSAHVYVASEFGGWQARVLRWLAQHFDEATNSFAKEASSGVIEQVQCWHSAHCHFRA